MSERERIRAEAFVEAMLALGVREMTVRPQHVHDMHAYEIVSTMEPEGRAVRFTIRRPVVIEGEFTVRG